MSIAVAVALLFASPDAETARIKSHLAGVEAELRATAHPELTAAQRRWRAQLLDELHRYWTRGRFPRNTYLPVRTPVFVDQAGTHCAVAHLIAASGRRNLVARVATSRNTAYIAELVDDGGLIAWLDEHGLTAAEAARIQPSYDPFPAGHWCFVDDDCASDRCIQLHPRYGYCTERCGEDGSCPAGEEGVPMECGPYGPEHDLCLYPSPAPGDFGWPCGDDGWCVGTCLADLEEPVCTHYCRDSTECPDGWECPPHDGEWEFCMPSEDGDRCSVGAASSSPGLLVLVIAWLLSGRRRRRPA